MWNEESRSEDHGTTMHEGVPTGRLKSTEALPSDLYETTTSSATNKRCIHTRTYAK